MYKFLSVLFLSLIALSPLGYADLADPAPYAILIDADSGTVLYEKGADTQMAPSSMSKLMTVLLVFKRLKDGALSLKDTLPVSENAWRKEGSKMFVKVGDRVTVEDLLRGIIVQSGNDACTVIAEGLGGSEENFAHEMNEEAARMGLTNSHFMNASGLPHPDHKSSCRDLAKIALALVRDFPEYYPMFGEKEFTYCNIKQGNRNPLLYGCQGADGLKTGSTDIAGLGVVGSAMREGRRLIVVVNGLKTFAERGQVSETLLNWGFRETKNFSFFKKGTTVVSANVWMGVESTVPLTVKEDVLLTLPRQERSKAQVEVEYRSPVSAPVKAGEAVGVLRVITSLKTFEFPLVAAQDVEKVGVFRRAWSALQYLLWGASA